jgi:hypothetical protein
VRALAGHPEVAFAAAARFAKLVCVRQLMSVIIGGCG